MTNEVLASAERGPRSSLRRQIGLGSATAIIVASVIGQGIFTTTGFLGHDLQHPGIVLLLWALGGLLVRSRQSGQSHQGRPSGPARRTGSS